MDELRLQKINDLLSKTNLDIQSQDLMRDFLSTIADQPQFDKIMILLDRFPVLFDNFCKCFQLKKEFIDSGKSEGEWQEFLEKEKDFLG